MKTGEQSVRATARWAGALNLLSAVPAGMSISILRKLIVVGDPEGTAARILGSEGWFRLAIVVDLFGVLLFIGSGVLLYRIFKPASRGMALFFLAAISMGSVIQALNSLPTIAALIFAKGGAGMSALPPAQANALAMVALKLYSESYKLALFFDAISSVAMGCLVLRSTFLPRIIGPLMWLDGVGGLTFTLAGFLSPPLAKLMYPYIPFVTVAIGEGALYLWLIIKSVDAVRWQEQAAAIDRAVPA